MINGSTTSWSIHLLDIQPVKYWNRRSWNILMRSYSIWWKFWILDLFLFFSFYLFLFQVSGIKLDMDKGNPDCEVSRNSFSNRCWKFQLSILKNKKVLFLKKYFFGRSQYQNKKALFTDSIFPKVLGYTLYDCYNFFFFFFSRLEDQFCWCQMPWN